MAGVVGIGELIGGWLGLEGGLATVVGSLIAIGGAMQVSRLINGTPGSNGGGAANAQGTRQQLQPSTENKIPVLYGSAYCTGMIVDAYLDNGNQTMTYVMVISETANQPGGTGPGQEQYIVNDIYWNDMRLVFENTDDPSRATAGKKNVNDPDPFVEDFTDTNFDNKVFVNIYAGGSGQNYQIFGRRDTAKNNVNRFIGSGAEHWADGTYGYQGLIFAIIQENYDAEKGFTGLPTVTFHMTNTISNPSQVLYDYMLSDRYGCNIPASEINGDSFTTFFNYCNQIVKYDPINPELTNMGNFETGQYYQIKDLGSTTQATWNSIAGTSGVVYKVGDVIVAHNSGTNGGSGTAYLKSSKRYEINGLIDTSRTCLDNIETILLNSGAWMNYNVESGLWNVVAKDALPGTTWTGLGKTGTATDPDPTTGNYLLLTDDDIIGGISISSTKLDNLYNAANIQFYDRYNRDQRSFNKISFRDSNPSLLNYNEPDNYLQFTFDLTNNNVQAERLANLELKQSRDDLIITFTTGPRGLQLQAGDVLSIYAAEPYGWYDDPQQHLFPYGKLFRVLTTKEKEDGKGGLFVEFTAIEYNADVYSDESIKEFTTKSNIGIIPIDGDTNMPPPKFTVTTVNNNSNVPNFGIKVTVPPNGGPYDEIQIWVAEGDAYAGYGADISFMAASKDNQLAVTSIDSFYKIRYDAGLRHRLRGWYDDGHGNLISLDDQNIYIIGSGDGTVDAPGNGGAGSYTLSGSITPAIPLNPPSKIYATLEDAYFQGTIKAATTTSSTMTASSVVNDIGTYRADLSARTFNCLVEETTSAGVFTGTVSGNQLTITKMAWGRIGPPYTGTTPPSHPETLYLSGTGIDNGTTIHDQVLPLRPGEYAGREGRYTLSTTYAHDIVSVTMRANRVYPGTQVKSGQDSGGAGNYALTISQHLGTQNGQAYTQFPMISKYPYPNDQDYQYLQSIKPAAGQTVLFTNNELRTVAITNLPSNQDDKVYFLKCRMGRKGVYGPFSDINEVDLEVPHVYWNPSNSGALQVKQALLRMDFGQVRIPLNGFWLLKTAQVLDFGQINMTKAQNILDLGLLKPTNGAENIIDANTDFENFVFQDQPAQ